MKGGISGNFVFTMWAEKILHVDMDAFFVEVERRRDPSLRGIPVAVGGRGDRGVIASASYQARRFGVRSAQPTKVALRLCPQLVMIPPSHGLYREASEGVFAILRSYTHLVEGLSLDEAFLDVGGLSQRFDSPLAVGETLREQITSELALPASVGVGSSKLIAKLASEAAKPHGIKHVPQDSELDFLHPLPAQALWGVGPATLAALRRYGVVTVGDIAELPKSTLVSALGPTVGSHLADLARGIDPRPVQPDSETKSISVEETYDQDLKGKAMVEAAMLTHAERLSARLRRSGLMARTVTVKARFEDFTTVTRSHTLPVPVADSNTLYSTAIELLTLIDLTRPIRLLGLGGAGLEAASAPRQLTLGESGDPDPMAETLAAIGDRFGDQAVSRLGSQEQRKREGSADPDD